MIASVITAKKDSQRLPNKNMLDFCGHPLTAWSIIQSQCSAMIDVTYLSTDGEEIAKMGESYGAEIIMRDFYEPPDTPVNVPLCRAIEVIQKENDLKEVVNLLPTSPLRLPEDIDNMIRLKHKIGIYEMGSMVPHNEVHEAEITRPGFCKTRLWNKTGKYVTQGGGMSVWDAGKYIEQAGIMTEDVWTQETIEEQLKKGNKVAQFFFREAPFYPLKLWQTYDIDYQEEFDFIQILMEYYILKGRGIDVYEEYYKGKTRGLDRTIREVADRG